jgi:phosphopantothenoylcysteine synthetase/decarboxylase
MNILVTAGNTQTPIDRVRAITNIFTGQTGTRIALAAHRRGHAVTLLRSFPEVMATYCVDERANPDSWEELSFRTFDDLQKSMEREIRDGQYDAVVHCAAVSDYRSAGVYAPAPGTGFDPGTQSWHGPSGGLPTMIDRAAGKVKSDENELWLRLVRTLKLIDLIRSDWAFRGILVKFKLEVGVSDEKLLTIAESSRLQSGADVMVANTLEGMEAWAFLGPIEGKYEKIDRPLLYDRLVDFLEALHKERSHV